MTPKQKYSKYFQYIIFLFSSKLEYYYIVNFIYLFANNEFY